LEQIFTWLSLVIGSEKHRDLWPVKRKPVAGEKGHRKTIQAGETMVCDHYAFQQRRSPEVLKGSCNFKNYLISL
jgi:hypothetical protein